MKSVNRWANLNEFLKYTVLNKYNIIEGILSSQAWEILLRREKKALKGNLLRDVFWLYSSWEARDHNYHLFKITNLRRSTIN